MNICENELNNVAFFHFIVYKRLLMLISTIHSGSFLILSAESKGDFYLRCNEVDKIFEVYWHMKEVCSIFLELPWLWEESVRASVLKIERGNLNWRKFGIIIAKYEDTDINVTNCD